MILPRVRFCLRLGQDGMERKEFPKMTDERMTVPAQPVQCGTSAPASVVPLPITRRLVLRGASAVVPTILTLQSGAALANASNGMISGSSGTCGTGETVPVDSLGNYSPSGTPHYACLETDGVSSGPYDFIDGNPLKLIPADVRFKDTTSSCANKLVSGDDLCRTGGPVKYPPTGGQPTDISIPRGMLLSATAYSSLAASGVIDPQFLNL